MSLCYADALSPYDNKGAVGMPEKCDSDGEFEEKCNQLADLLQNSKCCFVVAGAGISTSAGIADFRGPTGVWTLEKEGKAAVSVDFSHAIPTYTHMALVELERRGIVKYMVSQNVDGLTPKSGFPLNRLAELHGNVFCEICNRCKRKYYRDFIVGTVGLKLTGRKCEGTPSGRLCRGKLVDSVLDWRSELPEQEYATSNLYAKNADLVICLGTSLQIVPVGDMPMISKTNGAKVVTVNLQATKYENKVDIAIHRKVDEVMRTVLNKLKIPMPHGNGGDIVAQSSIPLEKFPARKRKSEVRKQVEPKIKRKSRVPVKEESPAVNGTSFNQDQNGNSGPASSKS